jgi:hypothetical protein
MLVPIIADSQEARSPGLDSQTAGHPVHSIRSSERTAGRVAGPGGRYGGVACLIETILDYGAMRCNSRDRAKAIGSLRFFRFFAVAEEVSVDYFRAQDVLSHLAETADRGLWGSFKGSAGKWERIVKAYEANSECLFLACLKSITPKSSAMVNTSMMFLQKTRMGFTSSHCTLCHCSAARRRSRTIHGAQR